MDLIIILRSVKSLVLIRYTFNLHIFSIHNTGRSLNRKLWSRQSDGLAGGEVVDTYYTPYALCTPALICISAIKHRARALFDRGGINPTVQSR